MCDAIWDGDRDQIRASRCVEPNRTDFLGKSNVTQLGTVGKGTVADCLDALWKVNCRQLCAPRKGIGTNHRDSIRNGNVLDVCPIELWFILCR